MTEQKKDDGDYLGYGVYADTLWARVERALAKDQFGAKELGDDPLVVGIFGEWGAGKSKLLQMVRTRAVESQKEQQKDREGDKGFSLTVPVYFQPWKYEHEQHLHVPLMMHIVAAFKDALQAEKGLTTAIVEIAKKAPHFVGALAIMGHKAAIVGGAIFPFLRAALGSISIFGTKIELPEELGDWLEDAAGATSESEDKQEKRDKKKKDAEEEKAKQQIRYTADGLHFYRITEYLEKLTRPGNDPKLREQLKIQGVTETTKINFVIFIDDLDRCLPENAVKTLELIKTIFNLESFAFVLALDEEVVERGIAHRYKDYGLADKKHDMPITGFEYLEKIVHLPFRLPALGQEDALKFVQEYESQLLKLRADVLDKNGKSRQAWFLDQDYETKLSDQVLEQIVKKQPNPEAEFRLRGMLINGSLAKTGTIKLNLAHLVLNAFVAYVPRKLVRIVELFHQTLDVLNERERLNDLKLGNRLDPRLLLAFILLQLFHPDLYRNCRRTVVGFDALRDAFKAGKLSKSFSDMDLMHWACFLPDTEAPPRDMKVLLDQLSVIKDRDGQRGPAERVQLPLVRSIMEHRAAGRHAFDSMALFDALQVSAMVVPLHEEGSFHYFSLLAEVMPSVKEHSIVLASLHSAVLNKPTTVEIPENAATGVIVEEMDSQELPAFLKPARNIDAQAVYRALISSVEREQAGVVGVTGLSENDKLSSQSALDVVDLCRKWLDEAKANPADLQRRHETLLKGLPHIAPALLPAGKAIFWELAKDGVDIDNPDSSVVENIKPPTRVLWDQARSALGQDSRFNPDFYYLPKEKFKGNTDEQEPLAGFVKVEDFLIARYLTTVDQYACFFEGKDYKKLEFWHVDSLKWLQHESYRKKPYDWDKQRAHGSHPVSGLTWYEAFAYAQWLQDQEGFKGKYTAHLPTETQWERAARAASHTEADGRDYPWAVAGQENEKTAHLHANILGSGIWQTSVVGLFPPSPIGLHDISGNLWEWQGNLYDKEVKNIGKLIEKLYSIEVKSPALRGGSCFDSADRARSDYRDESQPGNWNGDIGFRVVLSLA